MIPFHAPTTSTVAIGIALTLVDLYIAQHFAAAQLLDDLDEIKLDGGGTLLEALEAADLVSIRRDISGLQIERRFGITTIMQSAFELLEKDLRESVAAPLSNWRLKLAAPDVYTNGVRYLRCSRNVFVEVRAWRRSLGASR